MLHDDATLCNMGLTPVMANKRRCYQSGVGTCAGSMFSVLSSTQRVWAMLSTVTSNCFLEAK